MSSNIFEVLSEVWNSEVPNARLYGNKLPGLGFFRCLRIAWRLGRIAFARTLWKLFRSRTETVFNGPDN
ncbi:hypothetical protein B5X24_HaOG214631 [Helicoverpa armigera]|nr:hypothetical protein B5X24_HaOG214631 [Helicoverpa armigera]